MGYHSIKDLVDLCKANKEIITKRQRKRYKPRKCLYFLGFLYAS